MITTPEVKRIYASLQKQLFYLVPEKWDKIYLYASVVQQMMNLETGELFFYYFPKGILKKNPVNVYEIPSKFNLNEEEYIKLVEKLYHTIKELREVYKREGERVWSNLTIKLIGLKFEIEFNYENLTYSKYSSTERHIIWKYKNLGLPIESFNRKERKLIEKYLDEYILDIGSTETYTESIYKRPIKNVVEYNKEKVQEQNIDEYVQETEMERLSRENKQRMKEQATYTYIKKERKGLKKQYKQEEKKTVKEMTYVEQIEAQRNAVKSQILNHL